MYKTSLLRGPLRHHHKNRYTSHEICEFLRKVVILLARHDRPTLKHSDFEKGPKMKKSANYKRIGSARYPDYVDETRVFNKTSHFTRTGDDLRT